MRKQGGKVGGDVGDHDVRRGLSNCRACGVRVEDANHRVALRPQQLSHPLLQREARRYDEGEAPSRGGRAVRDGARLRVGPKISCFGGRHEVWVCRKRAQVRRDNQIGFSRGKPAFVVRRGRVTPGPALREPQRRCVVDNGVAATEAWC
jgi:hypothetical protein